MRLTAKLVTAIVLGVIVLIIVDAFESARRAVTLYRQDIERHAGVIARLMRPVLEDEWSTNGVEHALRILEDVKREDQLLQMRWVWPDADGDGRFRPRITRAEREAILRGENVSVLRRGEDGRRHLFFYAPLSVPGEPPAALELRESIEMIDSFAGSIRRRAVGVGIISAVLGAAVILSLGVVVVGRPLNRIVGKVRRIGAGDLDQPLAVHGHDELAELARAINALCDDLAAARDRARKEMMERIRAIEQLRHADRLATVGTLASGMAHELGTPLNVISGRAGLMAKSALGRDEVVANTEIIKDQADRMTRIIRQLLDFARRRAPAMEQVELHGLLRECCDVLRALARKRNVEISLGATTAPAVPADAGQLLQVFTNLLINAVQAMPRGGRIEMGIEMVEASPPQGHDGRPGRYVRVDIRDEGEGIAPGDLHYIFDPFFTTKQVGEGTGLGLSIAYGIIAEHGGWIDVTSQPGKGSCFSVFLPLEGTPCPAESSS
jgi:two-component system NtrC family sensor kinase